MLHTIPLSPIDLANIYKDKTDDYVLHVDYTRSKEGLSAKQILIYLANTGFRCTFDSIDDDLIQAYMEMDFLVDSPVLSRIVVEIIKQRMDDAASAPSQKELVDDWINAMAELPAFVMGNVNDQECEVAFDVDAIDTVGSGDAFNGGLAVAISEGLEIDEALVWGAAAGALSTTRSGAAGAMPDRAELISLISSSR